jgi:hypothetical protein
LLDNRRVGLRAVPGIQANVGNIVPDEEAGVTIGDTAEPTTRIIPRTLIIEGHKALRLKPVLLDSAIISAKLRDAASALLDGQAGPIAGAAFLLWSRLETLAAPDIDQRPITQRGIVSSRRQRRRDRDYRRCR